jgi:hypothetical protein
MQAVMEGGTGVSHFSQKLLFHFHRHPDSKVAKFAGIKRCLSTKLTSLLLNHMSNVKGSHEDHWYRNNVTIAIYVTWDFLHSRAY